MYAIFLGVLDYTVAFLNHVGISKNFNQVTILHTRGTPVYEKREIRL